MNIKEKLPLLLSIGAIFGVATTVYTTHVCTLKAQEDLYFMPDSEKPKDKAEELRKTWPRYLPVVVSAGLTSTAIIFSYRLGAKQIAALSAGGLAISQMANRMIKEEKKNARFFRENELRQQAKEEEWKIIAPWGKPEASEQSKDLFWDEFSRQFFYSSKVAVQSAETALNYSLHTKGIAYLEQFYDMLGLDGGDAAVGYGWKSINTPWISFDHIRSIPDNEEERVMLLVKESDYDYYIIAMDTLPEPLYGQ